MDKLLIRGGQRLKGEVAIASAKNAALTELCVAKAKRLKGARIGTDRASASLVITGLAAQGNVERVS
jgi:UDP-N-acetylglucosamine enolpyruvyl transferase